MSEQWSPGKWHKLPGLPYVQCGDKGPRFGPVVDAGSFDEMNACASVMAAAKELYEALTEVVALSDRKHDAWDKARAALAKARGET
jgi:hypothetical protein